MTNQTQILLIEGKRADNPSQFNIDLSNKKYSVDSVRSQTEALEYLDNAKPNVILIDLASMRSSGRRMCKSVRQKAQDIPIIIILDEEYHNLNDYKADVLLVKPFTTQKLINRIKPLLPIKSNDMIEIGPLVLDIENRWVKCGRKKTKLTPRLIDIMKMLMESPGIVIERKDLFQKVWDTDYMGDTRTLDVHISWLREAIEKDPRKPQFIKTIRGVGYRLDTDTIPRSKTQPIKKRKTT